MRVGRVLVCAVTVGVLAAAAVGAVTAATGVRPAPRPAHGAAPWPAPADPLRLARAAGLAPERKESFTFHVHAHLDVYVNGKHVIVPAGIGINIKDPGVHSGPNPDGSTGYGGIRLCATPCISPLHTHDDSGILHTESPTAVPNRLGQFFTEWHVRLSRTCVGGYCRPSNVEFYVNGKRYTGDPRAVPLTDRKEIAIVIGTPPKEIPKTGFA